jgi:hypothetical protein
MRIGKSFIKSLVAVVAGNLFYFFILMPHLPPAGQHGLFRIDLGLVIDFWCCVVAWGVIELVTRRKSRKGRT